MRFIHLPVSNEIIWLVCEIIGTVNEKFVSNYIDCTLWDVKYVMIVKKQTILKITVLVWKFHRHKVSYLANKKSSLSDYSFNKNEQYFEKKLK